MNPFAIVAIVLCLTGAAVCSDGPETYTSWYDTLCDQRSTSLEQRCLLDRQE